MTAKWIPSRSDQHCPTCGALLEERVGVFQVLERPDPVYIGDGTSRCPNGHQLAEESDG